MFSRITTMISRVRTWMRGIGTHRSFVIGVGVALLALLALGLYLWRCGQNDSIAIFNLCVDIVIGTFTIWGLYWAATEFARRPDLRLVVGRPTEPSAPVHHQREFISPPNPLLRIPGWYERLPEHIQPPPFPRVVCGLSLENKSSKAGRYIRVVICALATPAPSRCVFLLIPNAPQGRVQFDTEDDSTGQPSSSVQLEESLVVYQSRVLVGGLLIGWDPELPKDELPESVVLDYDIYTLDGASNGKIKLDIEWSGDV